LILNAVKFNQSGDRNLLLSPVVVANVLATPVILENNKVIFQTATNEWTLQSSSFVGARKMDLYFNPPLLKDIQYQVISSFPLADDAVVLRLRRGYQWSEVVGPLKLIGVDTGGGRVQLNGADGIVVADVRNDLRANPFVDSDTSSGGWVSLQPLQN
jgi:hypothetical protein